MSDAPRGRSGNGGPDPATPTSVPPEQMASVLAPPPLMDMNSFFLQSIMEVQKSVSELTVKTERLISDVAKQNEKIDEVGSQIKFAKGAAWIIGILLAAMLTAAVSFGVAIYNKVTPAAPTAQVAPPVPVAPSRR